MFGAVVGSTFHFGLLPFSDSPALQLTNADINQLQILTFLLERKTLPFSDSPTLYL
jgi:hypothetical protein